jgi:hypothetical protein
MNTNAKRNQMSKKGFVVLDKTNKNELIVTVSRKFLKGYHGVIFRFQIPDKNNFVVTVRGEKHGKSHVYLCVSNDGTHFSCQKIFTKTRSKFAQMVPNQKSNFGIVGIFFKEANPKDFFLIDSLDVVSKRYKQSILVPFVSPKNHPEKNPGKKSQIKNKPEKTSENVSQIKSEKNNKKKNQAGIPEKEAIKKIDIEKIKEILSQTPGHFQKGKATNRENNTIALLTEQLEKISKLKSDMEKNFDEMYENQKKRIRKLEHEKKEMKLKIQETKNKCNRDRNNDQINEDSFHVYRHEKGNRESENDDENYENCNSISISMDRYPSIEEMSDSMDSSF